MSMTTPVAALRRALENVEHGARSSQVRAAEFKKRGDEEAALAAKLTEEADHIRAGIATLQAAESGVAGLASDLAAPPSPPAPAPELAKPAQASDAPAADAKPEPEPAKAAPSAAS